MTVLCPTCNKRTARPDAKYRPFCSERCKLIDLGKWLDGDYRIPGEAADVPEDPHEQTPSDDNSEPDR